MSSFALKVTLADVIVKARDDLLTDRPELFMKDDSVYALPT